MDRDETFVVPRVCGCGCRTRVLDGADGLVDQLAGYALRKAIYLES